MLSTTKILQYHCIERFYNYIIFFTFLLDKILILYHILLLQIIHYDTFRIYYNTIHYIVS